MIFIEEPPSSLYHSCNTSCLEASVKRRHCVYYPASHVVFYTNPLFSIKHRRVIDAKRGFLIKARMEVMMIVEKHSDS